VVNAVFQEVTVALKRHFFVCASLCIFLPYLQLSADNVPPSKDPPTGLSPKNVPQFVVIGFDDQMKAEPMSWVISMFKDKMNPKGTGQAKTFDNTKVRAVFYTATTYLNGSEALHKQAYNAGHEIGNHTNTHVTAFTTPEEIWKTEMKQCNDMLIAAGIPKNSIVGFRAPFLQYTNATFRAIQAMGFVYDCSIEEGFQGDQDGTNFFWPYTLDSQSPGNKLFVDWQMGGYELLVKYPGLWELPCYIVIVPPDDKCAQFGTTAGLRKRIHDKISYFDEKDGKITGLDYNLWFEAGIDQNAFAAILMYTLDLHYNGNRAPMFFGCHSNYYDEASHKSGLEKFVDFALSKPDVRIVPAIKFLDWMHSPVGLIGTSLTKGTTASAPHASVKRITESGIALTIFQPGRYEVSLVSVNGRSIVNKIISVPSAGTYKLYDKSIGEKSRQVYIVSVQSESGMEYLKKVLDIQ
jgi:peptidoglycan/xylan/chitin deacetylase (PgdA/CDA1 family)